MQPAGPFTEERRRIKASGNARIDYIGILLFAVGFGALEVVLDKGQEDDWFGSSFITTFSVISVIALVVAIIWELHHKDPVVDLSLLANRNFALACVLFFLFGFILFSTTVLMPQLLQTLDKYDATTAGMVLHATCPDHRGGALCVLTTWSLSFFILISPSFTPRGMQAGIFTPSCFDR